MATLALPRRDTAAATPAPHRPEKPRWERPALLLLLAGTAVLYLWNLGASGYANSFYAAAVQAGATSWKAMFFGALDGSSFITVDKPPASLWVMALSGRIFGFNAWSMLVPQALEGVASVALLYAAVRRWSGPAAGLLAGAALALTPAAALMFRFNNPDALLTLLLVAAAYGTVRALERASTGWLLLAGTALGFGFLTKMLQAFLVLPALALVYLIAAPTSSPRRLVQLAGAGLAVIVSAGWWVAVAELWPASSRPYIGGSTNNSVLELTFGYNGLGRIFGGDGPGGGSGPGGGPGAGGNVGFGGAAGLTRMFGEAFGAQISWLLPAALIALVAGLWLAGRAPRTDRFRASTLLWGGWLLVNGLVFSYMQGIVHPYYSVVLAPPIAALVAVTGVRLWRGRDGWFARVVLAVMVAGTGIWAYVLLRRTPDWHPELRYLVVVGSVLATSALLLGVASVPRIGAVVAGVALFAALAGTAAYAVETVATVHNGPIPNVGPASAGDGFMGRGGPGAPEGADSALVALLKSTDNTWAAATMGSQEAASLQLASGRPVMAMGGFSGGDPAPSLAQFQAYAAAGKIHYFIAGGGVAGPGDSGSIATWVQANFTATTVGGQTVYDLTSH
jgi:4-amino-4-deoxy-L-arabinose transferase-like glycosyltransferase